jgi:NAD(P)-dependent dehydrogenase (short-subunit alcohol dehydrogenase family)
MSPLLEVKVIAVTGGASGIGLAICLLTFRPRRSPGGPH